MSNTSTTSNGIGILGILKNFFRITISLGILQIVFIVLKLTGVIDWSWFWVLAPVAIQFAQFALWFIVLVISWIVL